MVLPTVNFSTADWVDIPPDTQYIEIILIAEPPVAANLAVVVFNRPLVSDETSQWAKVKSETIDNLAYTASTPSTLFAVDPDNYYSFKVQGEAHVLMPGYQDFQVGLLVSIAGGKALVDYGGPTTVDGQAAGIVGISYLRYGGQ